ncbi:MAG: rRNA maturation RNase YbeY [Firmicutes bacterium]|nr:rRNA maturation RNase YbeY [Bacillota bacterium]
MKISIRNNQKKIRISRKLVNSVIKTAPAEENADSEGELSILFTGDQFIQKLNKKYRGIDSPTDVLAFPMEDPRLLGDIVISAERALAQASDFNHPAEHEIAFLLVHGFLHLLGYSDKTKEKSNLMMKRARAIISKLDLTGSVR